MELSLLNPTMHHHGIAGKAASHLPERRVFSAVRFPVRASAEFSGCLLYNVSFLASPFSPPRARALSASVDNNAVPHAVSRLQCKNSASLPSPLNVTSHVSLAKRMPVHVQASAEAGAADAAEQPEKPKPVASIEDMPLESKQQMILEQRARMKLAKKLRQRRKRLVQKRRLRKKGRWPPSKMKKLKNV
ncbi:50S ribosomal protein 5, chloroplastic [Brachypodium distachyon]|uniref:50S ribosomal protein 5, chloroplastic n=1 Tax=Brachypodium distachyon TaxID=15368 RepID=I1HEJ8_BRADI|nr:50S ribosomal protein 5, chloroplastic [Brachypodium distachyon]KQK03933.1 hypothetical protein BRADI_2g10740v3 [Brachypodium distachyon]|eukprot:XP_003567251.1 50S ribosomal protein 5, chloroplastic [Brachypodium distachyon]